MDKQLREIERKAIVIADYSKELSEGKMKEDVIDGHKGVWLKCEDGALFVREGESVKQAFDRTIELADGFENMPEGWTSESLAKFARSLTGKTKGEEGFFRACVVQMKGKVTDENKFCGSLKARYFGK